MVSKMKALILGSMLIYGCNKGINVRPYHLTYACGEHLARNAPEY